ncbi:MAG: hypothetical protein M1821_008500 [Bathelium mastoideum]|nr:MAG: hypothetical protein M1821_008500 [Bathelium mastoideum]
MKKHLNVSSVSRTPHDAGSESLTSTASSRTISSRAETSSGSPALLKPSYDPTKGIDAPSNQEISNCKTPSIVAAADEAKIYVRPSVEEPRNSVEQFFVKKLKEWVLNDVDLAKKLDLIAPDEGDLLDPNDPDGKETRYEASGLYIDRDLDDRRRRAPLRLIQAKAHTQLIEDRINDLEAKVRKILKEPDPSLDEDQNTFPRNEIEIKYLPWREFNVRFEIDKTRHIHWKHRPEIDLEPKSVIEILWEEPFNTGAYIPSSELSSAEFNVVPSSQVPESMNSVFTDYPYRIRIRSQLLLQVIKEATGCQTTLGPYRHRLLLLRPFKLLVTHYHHLRSALKRLEDKHQKVEEEWEPNSHSPPSMALIGSVAGPEKETETMEAQNLLRLLCTTINTCFKPQVELLHNLSPDSGKVKFTDLWYLFKPGYEVRTPGNSRIQLYRVVKVNGGRDSVPVELSRSGLPPPGVAPPPELPASKKLKNDGYSKDSFIVECFYINFDGNQFGPVNVTFQIRKYEGDKDIVSLPVYPLTCDRDEKEIRADLLKRGSLFADLSNPKSNAHRKYKGLTLDRKRQEHVESEVVIDFQLAFTQTDIEKPVISLEKLVDDDQAELQNPRWAQATPICSEGGCCSNDIIYKDYEIDENERRTFSQNNKNLLSSVEPGFLTDEQLTLMPPRVYGFVLRTRKWATFDIDRLEPPDYSNGWDNLVVKPEIKEMVLALVENHQRPLGSRFSIEGALPSVDLVQGKGKGLIILLHGEPGVGKTSTAECVAGHTKRPLFPITCGDIGEKADEVEDNLERNFQLAHKWGCVLLLDEADQRQFSVFLSKRTSDDIQRNAIVSVFLRTLEYYSGILFLTTNRVGKIDKAFKSRIHLSLRYPKLDLDSTLRIWENNLKAIKIDMLKQNMQLECDEEEIRKFAKKHFKCLEARESKSQRNKVRIWNGRQIRNAFQTAVAIAKYEAGKQQPGRQRVDAPKLSINAPQVVALSEKHFKDVADMSLNFEKYLNTLHNGKNDADLAKMGQTRVDDFSDEEGHARSRKKDKERSSRKRSPSTEKWQKKKRRRNNSPESTDVTSDTSSDSS